MSDRRTADQARVHFRKALTSTPQVLAIKGPRGQIVFTNESGGTIYIGHSGTVTVLGFAIPTLQQHQDRFSLEEWWGWVPSSSGIVSGYITY